MFIAKLDCYIAGEFLPTARALIGYFQVSWNLTMKLFTAKLSERATLQNPWRHRVTALFSANVDRRPPLQRGLLNIQPPNFQGSASGDIEIFEKQNELFSLGPVIKCLLLDLLTTVGPPLDDHSKCEDLLVNYGTLLLTDLFGENLLHAISKVRHE